MGCSESDGDGAKPVLARYAIRAKRVHGMRRCRCQDSPAKHDPKVRGSTCLGPKVSLVSPRRARLRVRP